MLSLMKFFTNLTITTTPHVDYHETVMNYRTLFSSGYSLIEVLITLCIISFIFTGNITLLITAVQRHNELLQYSSRVFTYRDSDIPHDNMCNSGDESTYVSNDF